MKRKFPTWLGHRLPACDEVARLASERLDRRLSLREWLSLRLHLRLCLWCRRYLEQLEALHCAAPGLAGNEERAPGGPALSGEARERLERLLAGGGAAPERQ